MRQVVNLSGCSLKANVLKAESPSAVAEADHRARYREMFAPTVTAGWLKPSDLAGYRSEQVYIRKFTHVPLNREAVPLRCRQRSQSTWAKRT
jgi:hypothetical protein